MPHNEVTRRNLLKAGVALSVAGGLSAGRAQRRSHRPNVVFVFADQWRADATGYAGNPDVRTPHLDKLAAESVNFTTAVSGCPVCSPYRASLMTGQYWLTHGIFYNDKPLGDKATSVAQACARAGYDTAYIGKWHLNGHPKGVTMAQGRAAFIPRQRRQGFQFWRACECTHNYNHSLYYGDTPEKRYWEGYDAIAQTREAQRYIRSHSSDKPFVLFLSWGPPHAPYHTAPAKYKALFPDPAKLWVRPNVPEPKRKEAQKLLAGYYAHIAALDDCMGEIGQTLRQCGIEENTIFVFTADHGDMLLSHGLTKKQKPWDESIRVPFLLRYPGKLGRAGREIDAPINTPDIMPTLLGLCGVDVPSSCEGRDRSAWVTGAETPGAEEAALITLPVPFHQWSYARGGREYRGLRTSRYTYVRDLNGPWLLYDNREDPYQLRNLCNRPEYARVQQRLNERLDEKLRATNDAFLPGPEYMKMWDYDWDGSDTPKSVSRTRGSRRAGRFSTHAQELRAARGAKA